MIQTMAQALRVFVLFVDYQFAVAGVVPVNRLGEYLYFAAYLVPEVFELPVRGGYRTAFDFQRIDHPNSGQYPCT